MTASCARLALDPVQLPQEKSPESGVPTPDLMPPVNAAPRHRVRTYLINKIFAVAASPPNWACTRYKPEASPDPSTWT